MNDLTQQLARQQGSEELDCRVQYILPSVNLYLDRIEFIIRLAIVANLKHCGAVL